MVELRCEQNILARTSFGLCSKRYNRTYMLDCTKTSQIPLQMANGCVTRGTTYAGACVLVPHARVCSTIRLQLSRLPQASLGNLGYY